MDYERRGVIADYMAGENQMRHRQTGRHLPELLNQFITLNNTGNLNFIQDSRINENSTHKGS